MPLKPEDIRQGDFIKFSRPGGKISKGMVKYMGPLPERGDVYFGLELDSEGGYFLSSLIYFMISKFLSKQKENMTEFTRTKDIFKRK